MRLEDRKALLNLIYSHRDAVAVNDEIGHVTIKPHVIQMEENKAPTFTPAYRLTHACRELIEKEVEKLKKQEIIPAVSNPLERVGVDLIEMTPSYEGNKYILTVIDHFSRYVSAYPLPNKTCQSVSEAMFRFVCDKSVPREVVSDRGTEFNNELFKKVCEKLKDKNKFRTRYHPMANGAKEKGNSNIKKTLSQLSEEDRFCWDKQVSLTCLAINTSYQSRIKEIPFFIQHGRDARLPFNDLVNKLPEINYAEEDYAAEMSLGLSQAFSHVKRMSQRSRDSAVKYYNRKVAKEAKKISIG